MTEQATQDPLAVFVEQLEVLSETLDKSRIQQLTEAYLNTLRTPIDHLQNQILFGEMSSMQELESKRLSYTYLTTELARAKLLIKQTTIQGN